MPQYFKVPYEKIYMVMMNTVLRAICVILGAMLTEFVRSILQPLAEHNEMSFKTYQDFK